MVQQKGSRCSWLKLHKAKLIVFCPDLKMSLVLGDLTLTKGEEYEVLDDSQDHWWQVRNKLGEEGFIPSNYVKEKDGLGLQNHDW